MKRKYLKSILKNFQGLIIFTLFISCNKQDVITNVRSLSGYGKLKIEIEDSNGKKSNGMFKNTEVYSSDYLTFTLKNVGGLDITQINLPKNLPNPLYYENSNQAHTIFDQIEKKELIEIIDLPFQDLKIDELLIDYQNLTHQIPEHLEKNCQTLNTENEECVFRIYVSSPKNIQFNLPIKIEYNDGINNQTVIINLTGFISSPGEIYYSITPENDLLSYISNWRMRANEDKNSFAKECGAQAITNSPNFTRGIIEKYEPGVNFTPNGPMAFGLSSNNQIQLFNYGNEEIHIFKTEFAHLTLSGKSNNSKQTDSKYCMIKDLEDSKIQMIPDSFTKDGNSFFYFNGNHFPGLNGTCKTIIAPNTSCTIDITYMPKELQEEGGDTHKGILIISYNDNFEKDENNLSKKKSIQIQLSGTTKKDRAKVVVNGIGPATTSNLCPGRYKQGCEYLGHLPYGSSKLFFIKLENAGIIPATILPPILKIESFGLLDQFVGLNSELNNFILWKGFDLNLLSLPSIPPSIKDISGCKTELPPGETCVMTFEFFTKGFDENLPPQLEKVSRLLTFTYNDNDVVSPTINIAYISNTTVEKDTRDRINISADVTQPGILVLDKILENEIPITNNYINHLDSDLNYTFKPQEIAARNPDELLITLKNIGEYNTSDIKIIEDNESNKAIKIDRSTCPSIVDTSTNSACIIYIMASSIENGIFNKSFYIEYFNGVEQKRTQNFNLKATFSNTSKLSSFSQIKDGDIYNPLNETNNQFILDLEKPVLSIEVSNNGKSKAYPFEIKYETELTCGNFSFPFVTEEIQSNCVNSTIGDRYSSENTCRIDFKLIVDHNEILNYPDLPNPFLLNCKFKYEINYEDDFTRLMTIYYQLPIGQKISNSIEGEFNISLGEKPKIYIISQKDMEEFTFLTSNNDKILFLEAASNLIADFENNQQITEEISYQEEKNVFVINAGGITAKDVKFSTSLPNVFSVNESACNSITSLTPCPLQIKFRPIGEVNYSEKLISNYTIGESIEVKDYVIKGFSGNFGLIATLTSDGTIVQNKGTINLPNYIVGTTQTFTVEVKNFGGGPANITQLSDSTIKKAPDGTFTQNENQLRLEESTCSEVMENFPSQNSCLLKYEIVIKDTSVKTITLLIEYENTTNKKEHLINIVYSGIMPPKVIAEFIGPDSPISYDFKEIPKFTSKDKSITFRNVGKTDARNFNVKLKETSSEYFSIFYNTCDFEDEILPFSDSCEIRIRYKPNEESERIENTETGEYEYVPHTAELEITYDPIIEPATPIPFSVKLSGTSIIPNSNFSNWSDIKVFNEDNLTKISFSWEAFEKPDEAIDLDSYNIYYREDLPLPKNKDELNDFFIKEIIGNTNTDRVFSETKNLPAGKKIFYTVRAKYLDETLNIEKNDDIVNAWDIKIITPPKNMALIHPFIANEITCMEMHFRPNFEESIRIENELLSLDPLKNKNQVNFACPMEKIENEIFNEEIPQFYYKYFDFGKFLFVDRYELSTLPGSTTFQNEPGLKPYEFTIPISATSACANISVDLTSGKMQKRLLNRQEWFMAASWPEKYTKVKIDSIETGENNEDCYYNKQLQSDSTGSHSNCISRFGIYDMVGNLWEWNSNQINVIIGLDQLLGINFLIPGSNAVSFPTDLPCYSYIHGLAFLKQYVDGQEKCVESINGSEISQRTPSYYFPPNPMNKKLKNIRSGGGIGERIGATDSTIKIMGRHVVDLDSYSATGTGARCGFSIPYTNN